MTVTQEPLGDSTNKHVDAGMDRPPGDECVGFSAKMELHFHAPELVSIIFENSGGACELRGEILFFCLFALRQLVNLGTHESSMVLAKALVAASGHLHELAQHDNPSGPKLVEYQGTPGRKRFEARMSFDGTHLAFKMKPKGFGWFGAGVGYYAPQSVLLLLRYLSARRISDPAYLRWLGLAGVACAAEFVAGEVGAANQTQKALDAVMEAGTAGEVQDLVKHAG